MSLDDKTKEAHAAARDSIKHVITLSTAAIGILVALFKDILGTGEANWLLWASILCFGVGSLFGTASLLCMAGNLEKKSEPTIYEFNVLVFAVPQVILFAGGMVLGGLSIF